MGRRRAFVLAIVVATFFGAGCTSVGSTPTATGTGAATSSPAPTAQASTSGPVASPSQVGTPVPAMWVAGGTLNLGRSATHAVRLASGNVLVVGEDAACNGEGNAAGTDSVKTEVYNPATGSWTTTGSLNAPRAYFAAEPLANGGALVTAGVNDQGISYSSSKLYDPATATWVPSALLSYARTDPAYALLNDGRVLVVGGTYYTSTTNTDLASAEIFNPQTATWSTTGSMNLPRRGARAVTLTSGRVLVVGGSPDEGASVTSAELWDPGTGNWSNVGSLATNRSLFSMLALPDGSALVAGGEGAAGPLASAERFDATTLTWSSAGNMQTAAFGRIAAVLPNGKVLLAGGHAGSRNATVAASELYDPAAGGWTPTVALPHNRADGEAVPLADGSILVVGGDDGPSTNAVGGGDCRRALPDALRYVPSNP